jgi:hypothetical protein
LGSFFPFFVPAPFFPFPFFAPFPLPPPPLPPPPATAMPGHMPGIGGIFGTGAVLAMVASDAAERGSAVIHGAAQRVSWRPHHARAPALRSAVDSPKRPALHAPRAPRRPRVALRVSRVGRAARSRVDRRQPRREPLPLGKSALAARSAWPGALLGAARLQPHPGRRLFLLRWGPGLGHPVFGHPVTRVGRGVPPYAQRQAHAARRRRRSGARGVVEAPQPRRSRQPFPQAVRSRSPGRRVVLVSSSLDPSVSTSRPAVAAPHPFAVRAE